MHHSESIMKGRVALKLKVSQQDDMEDWNKASKNMATVYANSYLNIATTFAPSSGGSCFSERKIFDCRDDIEWSVNSMPVSRPLGCTDSETGVRVRVEHTTGHEYILDQLYINRRETAPLLERAWVLQERVLAPRTVHFGSSEMLWECNSAIKCECNGISGWNATPSTNGSSSGTSTNPLKTRETSLKVRFTAIRQDQIQSEHDLLRIWHSIVHTYAYLSLTQPSDRPFAFAGLALLMSEKIRCDYLAGVWAVDLPHGLAWFTSGSVFLNAQRQRLAPPMPSWSWMTCYDSPSNSGGVNFVGRERDFVPSASFQVHYPDTFCKWDPMNPFGKILAAQLVVSAASFTCTLNSEEGDYGPDIHVLDYYIKTTPNSEKKYAFSVDCPTVDGLEDGETLLCVLLGTLKRRWEEGDESVALILKPLLDERDTPSKDSSGIQTYTRVGLSFHWLAESAFQDIELRKIRIL